MTRMLALLWLMSCASAQASNISSDRLIATARASLEAVSGMLPGELVLTASALPDSQLETEMAATTQMRLQAGRIGGAWPRKRVGVPVEVLVDGVPTQTRWCGSPCSGGWSGRPMHVHLPVARLVSRLL